MSEYTTYDFEESLGDIDRTDVERVIAAWGDSSGGYAEWQGGFLLALKDGRYAYITGWCDTTGWGCQDGRDIEFYDNEPDRTTLGFYAGQPGNPVPVSDWDDDPADLNRYVRGEIGGF